MVHGTLLPNSTEVKLVSLRPKARVIEMHLRACRSGAVCPSCNRSSSRVHSRDVRVLGDLPWEGLPVRIVIETRRFFCRSWQAPEGSSPNPCPERRAAMHTTVLAWVKPCDCAWRKGHCYGAIPCDLEQRRVIDLMSDRASGTAARWLKGIPKQRSSAVTGPVLMLKQPAELLRVRSRWRIDGICSAT
jgi:transposase